MDINALIEEEVAKRVKAELNEELNRRIDFKLSLLKQTLHQKIDEVFEELKETKSTIKDSTTNIDSAKCNFPGCKNYGDGSLDSICNKCVNHKVKDKSTKNNTSTQKTTKDDIKNTLYESIKPILKLYNIDENDIKIAELKLNDPDIKKNLKDMLNKLGLGNLDEI